MIVAVAPRDSSGNIPTNPTAWTVTAVPADASGNVTGTLDSTGQAKLNLGSGAKSPWALSMSNGTDTVQLGPVQVTSASESFGGGEIAALAGGGLRSMTYLTAASGTYTLPIGIRAILVEVVGDGGGAGGAATAASSAAAGAGGGGGGYARKFYSAPAATYSYTVGQGGAGGAAGNNNGTAGGGSTFDVMTANGGGGGGGSSASSTAAFGGAGAGGGAATGGDVNVSGSNSLPGIILSGTVAYSGQGGGTAVYSTQEALKVTAGNGGNGGNGGRGGTAGLVLNGSTAAAGGNGAPGVIVVWEFA